MLSAVTKLIESGSDVVSSCSRELCAEYLVLHQLN